MYDIATYIVKNELDVASDISYSADMQRIYTSNISPVWSFERQEAALAEAIPGYPKGVQPFRDDLDPRTRQGRRVAALSQRAEMLRPTTNRRNEVIVVASLAVLAWTIEDMMACLTMALTRGATVWVLDAGLRIPPIPEAEILHQATKAFSAGRAARAAYVGGKISGERKEAVARVKAETIRGVYGMPSDRMPWPELLRLSGLTRNTIIKHLGARKPHQVTYEANAKRAAAAVKRKAKREEAQGDADKG